MVGYAVIDVQTTGLDPTRHHRVVEIGVVVVDDHGRRGDSWSSLINPQRDIGASELHGITARDVHGAPTFANVAPLLMESLVGRTPVAHNTAFTMAFLASELERAGYLCPGDPPGVATMHHVGRLADDAPRRLVDCCTEFGISLGRRYSSAHQSSAVAEILAELLGTVSGAPPWISTTLRSRNYRWPDCPKATETVALLPRSAAEATVASSWLDRLIAKMPNSGDPDTEAYLDMLEMALLDRYLSQHEADALVKLANRLGLDQGSARSLHRDYLAAMAKVALEDSVVTPTEYRDLASVAEALGLTLNDVDNALASAQAAGSLPPAKFCLAPGDAICLTGAMSVPRGDIEAAARAKGLSPGSLTKRTKLLIAADPDSLSGKARKARDYGIPIVSETYFQDLLAEM